MMEWHQILSAMILFFTLGYAVAFAAQRSNWLAVGLALGFLFFAAGAFHTCHLVGDFAQQVELLYERSL